MFVLEDINSISKIHMIGIGGISMSALAQILNNNGYKITGSDVNSSRIVSNLINKGITIFNTHDEENVIGTDLIVRSAAIKDNNPEIVKARELNIPIIERSQLLGYLMKSYKYPIAVAGTHGKTTTTSMITLLLIESQKDPTALVGEMFNNINGNFRIGDSDFMVTEACEYCESFLDFYPFIGIILNIEEDHLDYYSGIDHIISSFNKFANLIPEDGYLVVCGDSDNSIKASEGINCNIVTFGINNKNCNWRADNIRTDNDGNTVYDCIYNNKFFNQIKLRVPGAHNIYNSLAAIATVNTLGIREVAKPLFEFKGANRRFQIKSSKEYTIVSDYAHHPTEIRATLNAARQYKYNKVWCVFQPHTYTRTYKLLDEFANSFIDADELIITDIYAAREVDDHLIHSKDLVNKITNKGQKVKYISGFNEIKSYIKNNIGKNDLVITMGAGSIDDLSDILTR